MDIVLVDNPNPLGAAVRAFRHLCLKDARKITIPAARFLGNAARKYSAERIMKSEVDSYHESVISPAILKFFEEVDTSTVRAIQHKFHGTSTVLQPLLI